MPQTTAQYSRPEVATGFLAAELSLMSDTRPQPIGQDDTDASLGPFFIGLGVNFLLL